ncbi:MAG TPA: reverse transcriptase domain-containing protein [Allosphingosinicella sp.]|nr:reverse transcriptase domain-containing protein [Allosphingosinicella sp.]
MAEAIQLMNHHFGRLEKLRRHREGERREAELKLQSAILRGFGGRFCAVIREHHLQTPTAPVSFAELQARAQHLDLFRKCGEVSVVHLQRKHDGSCRVVTSPSRSIRCRQRLLGQVLNARFGEPSDEFNIAGKGRDAAVLRVKNMIEQEGARAIVAFDIEDYFPSVKPKHLGWVRIPTPVLNHTLFFNRRATLFKKGPTGKAEAARQGLSQGASASGKIASALLGRELRHVTGDLGKVIYVDDGIIGACAPPDANAIAKTLAKRMAELNGGPLSFRYLKCLDVQQGFSFLGYWFRVAVDSNDAQVTLTPSHTAFVRCRQRLFARLKKMQPEWDAAEAIAEEHVKAWRRAFSLWLPDSVEEVDLNARVLSWLDDWFHGCTKKPGKPLLGTISAPV